MRLFTERSARYWRWPRLYIRRREIWISWRGWRAGLELEVA